MIQVQVNEELIAQVLTVGYSTNYALKVTQGLPPGCKLVGVTRMGGGKVLLLFATPDNSQTLDHVDVTITAVDLHAVA